MENRLMQDLKWIFLFFCLGGGIVHAQPDILIQWGHTNWVKAVTFSPDGKHALSSSSDQTLKLWDISTGREIRTFKGHSHSVSAIAFSPNGNALSGSRDNTLKLWDISTGQEIRTFTGHSNDVNAVAFSPDGKFALSGSDDQSLKLWQVSTGRNIRTFKGHTDWVNAVAFSPDGKFALSGSRDTTLKLWEISTGREIRTLKGHSNWINAVAFSPNGKLALSGSSDQTLKLWEISTGHNILTLKGHSNWVNAVAFSPNGKLALSASSDRTLNIWDISNGRNLLTLQGHSNWVNAVAFSPDSQLFLSGSSDHSIKLWDVSSGKEILTLKGPRIFGLNNQIIVENTSNYTLRGQVLNKTDLASFTINAQTVLLDKQGVFSFDIALQFGKNPIKIIAKDIFDKHVLQNITIINNDTKPPQIVLSEQHFIKNATRYTLQGQIIDETDVSLIINEQSVHPDTQGIFSLDVALQIGENPVELIAKDIFNNQTLQNITIINNDTIPPQIVLPEQHFIENATKYTLHGQVIDQSDISMITVNETMVHPDNQGRFSSEITLQIGENPVELIAKDIFNNQTLQNITIINNDTIPPQIVLPEQHIIENTTAYTLRGQVIDQSDISITINEQTVHADQQGLFSYQVSLPRSGKKHIQITATDIENNSTNQNITLELRCTPAKNTERLNRKDIEAMHRVKVAFKGERQTSNIPKDISPSCLQQAETLDLSHLELLELPVWLAKFTQLRKLDISHNQLNLEKLSLPKIPLEILDLSHNPLFQETCWGGWCNIEGTLPPIWQQLIKLRVLILSNTGGDAENYGDLSSFKYLYQLDLTHNHITTLAGMNLHDIKALQVLNLSQNQLENIDFAQLNPQLQVLDLSKNNLGHLTFSPLAHLSLLNLKDNKNVTFDIEFGEPLTLQALELIGFDATVDLPNDLKKKLESWKP